MELKEELEKLKIELGEQAMKKNEAWKIIDIKYYKPITFDDVKGEEQPLYLVEKEENGEIKRQLQAGDTVIADIGEDNAILMRAPFGDKINDILIQLKSVTPISLKELEKREQSKHPLAKKEASPLDKKQGEQNEEMNKTAEAPSDYIAEIDMDKKITENKTFAQLVPEAKEKQVETVRVRRIDNTRFEIYGVGKEGKDIPFESLEQVEGTNPTKEITQISGDGDTVEKNQVYSMFRLRNGGNEQNGNEGFTVDLEEGTGIPEVAYYRRSRDNEYTSIPVNLKNTNQKRTELEVREYAEKTKNPQVSDNVERADKILEDQESTSLENIDDNSYNDNSQTMEEYIEAQITQAAKRCRISEEGFIKEMEKIAGTIGEELEQTLQQAYNKGYTIDTLIEEAEDEINEQVIGGRRG